MGKIKSADLDFHLQGFRIAQHQRPYNEHRLLVYNSTTNNIEHIMFENIDDFLTSNDLLVFNNSRVIPVSIFLNDNMFILFIEPFKSSLEDVKVICPFKPAVGEIFDINGTTITLMEHEPGWDVYHANIKPISTKYKTLQDFLDDNAKIPMPIYLKRIPTSEDEEALQNIYADAPGSIATPVAGLHFSRALIDKLHAKGIRSSIVTLHVGYGTFRSFKTEYINEHKMDLEYYHVSGKVFSDIKETLQRGGRIIAVGTTSSRVLESIANRSDFRELLDEPKDIEGETGIFIYPPYTFKLVDGLITNFQYPRLPVLAMAAALTGLEKLRAIYDESLKEDYMYYSYGDAMLLLSK